MSKHTATGFHTAQQLKDSIVHRNAVPGIQIYI